MQDWDDTEYISVRVIDADENVSFTHIPVLKDKSETIEAVYRRLAGTLGIQTDYITIYMSDEPIPITDKRTLQEFQLEYETSRGLDFNSADLNNIFKARIIPEDFFCNVLLKNSDLFRDSRHIRAVHVKPSYTNARLYEEVAKVISSAIHGSNIDSIVVYENGYIVPKTTDPLQWKNVKGNTFWVTLAPGEEEHIAENLGRRVEQPIFYMYQFLNGKKSNIQQTTAKIYKKMLFDDFFDILDVNKPDGFTIGKVSFDGYPIVPGELVVNNSSRQRPFIVYEKTEMLFIRR